MPRKNKSAKSENAGRKPAGSRRSSASKPVARKARASKAKPKRQSPKPKPEPRQPKELCGAPLKKPKGAFCGKTAVTGGRCRYHIVEEELVDDLDTLRRLQAAAERHAFIADQEMKGGGNGSKDAAFNRNARTAAALAKARQEMQLRAAKTQDANAAPDPGTNIVIIDNLRGDGPPKDDGDIAATDPSTALEQDPVQAVGPEILGQKGEE